MPWIRWTANEIARCVCCASPLVGTMIYIAITARPDVAFAVGKLSRGMYSPNKLHCDMLKDVVGYLATRSLYHCGTLASIRESRCYSPNWLKEAQP